MVNVEEDSSAFGAATGGAASTPDKDHAKDTICTLITALSDFILPLVKGQNVGGPSSICTTMLASNSTQNIFELTNEANHLVDSLAKFVASLCQKSEQVPSKSSESSSQTVKTIRDSSSYGNSLPPENSRPGIALQPKWASTQKQEYLDSALKQAYQVVFNKRPIRLLKFNEAGKGIRLVPRTELYRHACFAIKREVHTFSYSSLTRAYNSPLDLVNKHTKYAILSHTWTQSVPGEVTYADWTTGAYDTQSISYSKLLNFCRVAATHYSTTFAWIDTLCIDKASSSELDESIRSMFKWYQGARVCITYLAQTQTLDAMHKDVWFTRGWTLQELVAPKRLKFYACDWSALGNPADKNDKKNGEILRQIFISTTITGAELDKPLDRIAISRRMQWAATRNVTREEDTAYSLMGIFDISISTAYGEGSERAFLRLVHEIIATLDLNLNVFDIANWGGGPSCFIHPTRNSCLIPPGPQAYAYCSQVGLTWYTNSVIPITLTRLRFSVPVLLMPVFKIAYNLDSEHAVNKPFSPRGDYYASTIAKERSSTNMYRVLDSAAFDKDVSSSSGKETLLFAVLNFREIQDEVLLPMKFESLAIMLSINGYSSLSMSSRPPDEQLHRIITLPDEHFCRVMTEDAITFQLQCQRRLTHVLSKDQLLVHGIMFRTLYL